MIDPQPTHRDKLALFCLVAVLAALPFACTPKAHGHDWYTGLKNADGYMCCDIHDFKPVRARMIGGEWHAWYPNDDGTETEWLIPDDKILPDELNREPFTAHLAIYQGEVRCFLRKAAGG